ncbi:MAG: alpha/beta hydrolase fold protein [Rhodocyclaceae bacterium]|nr:MAG: alpha/beta hydrolase fold protein [Rhodocyclaceae bacterium]TND05183.1 MAG: alpha/beta hydrolase fold protein [Rhodocyclaceae bacterium]
MTTRKLNTLRRLAKKRNGQPPLVFVHGGYVHAGCWELNFLPHFSALGYDCHAIDLSGHGASEGRENLDSFDIDHYAADVAQLVAELPSLPVLIGHSMGALVVQRYLEKGQAAGVIMMAPVPTTGLSACTIQLTQRQPDFLREAAYAVRGKYTENTARVMREVYFSPDVTHEQFESFKPLVQDESTTAITEMMALAWRPPKRRPKIPALVMGGELDALFPSNLLHFTASGWNAETCVIPRAGHMLMMEPQWTTAAAKIDNWLDRRLGLKASATA